MKIMAVISERDKTFLAEVTKEELTRIAFGERYRQIQFSVGDKVDVHTIFDRLYQLENNKKQLSSMAENLRAMATLLESTEPIIRELVDEPKESETTA